MKLVVGLGNYPEKYRYTRHNLGFLTVEEYAKRRGLKWKKGFFSKSALAVDRDREVYFLLPLTYMNNSGQAVVGFRREVKPQDILLVCDDMDLPWMRMRFRVRGSSGGHRGLESVISALGTEEIPRLRMGIGRPGDGDVVEYVLSEFSEEEKADLGLYLSAAFATIDKWISGEDPQKLMSEVNDPNYVMKHAGGENGA